MSCTQHPNQHNQNNMDTKIHSIWATDKETFTKADRDRKIAGLKIAGQKSLLDSELSVAEAENDFVSTVRDARDESNPDFDAIVDAYIAVDVARVENAKAQETYKALFGTDAPSNG